MGQHVEAAERYARQVGAGKVPACKWVKLACERHLDDLKRARKKDYPYRFDKDEAERICEFAELLPHTKGKWGKQRELIKLQPWQAFILCVVFGWLKKKNGKRRFREVYIEVPRKNGKSILAAVIGLFMFAMDGEFGPEIYSGATTEKQAWEVFKPARLMVERSDDLREAFGIEVWAKALASPADGGKFEPIIGKPGDGSSPSCAIVDEYHQHDGPDLYDTMVTGMGAREQPLALIITTAGFNLASPCYDKHSEVKKVLDGVIENDDLFGIIFSIDEGDDWTDPKSLIKANPNFGISVDEDALLSQQRQAVINPEKAGTFKTKHLNVWCSSRSAWMSMPSWNACLDPQLSIDEFAGEECWFSLDLASKLDICAFVQLFRKRINGANHYYAFGRYYLPEDTVAEDLKNGAAYRKWVAQSLLTPTDGAEIDFDFIREEVEEMKSRIAIQEIVLDPWRGTHLRHQLEGDGAECVEMPQKGPLMAQALDELGAAVKSGRFHHDGNPILAWMASNVVGQRIKGGMIVPTKEKPENKIDGIVALLMAISRAMSPEDIEQSFWEKETA